MAVRLSRDEIEGARMAQKRNTKTEQHIREALTRLLKTKGFDALTVSDVSREAGINRGTFYTHYVDKFDLLAKQIDSVIDDLTEILLAGDTSQAGASDLIPRENVLVALRYVRDNYEFVSALTSNGTDPRLQERLKDVLAQLLEREAARYPNLTLSYNGLPRDYGREMLLSSVTSVIWLWIRKDCAETPEQICGYIYLNKDLSPSELLA